MATRAEGLRSGGWLRDSRLAAGPAATLDAVWILVFVVLGRSSHTEGLRWAGIARTAWPFLVGLAAGWVVARAWRSPAALVPTAVTVWPVCVAVGMVLRAVSGQGVVAAFVAVALAFVGLGLLGWRALALLLPERGAGGAGSRRAGLRALSARGEADLSGNSGNLGNSGGPPDRTPGGGPARRTTGPEPIRPSGSESLTRRIDRNRSGLERISRKFR